MQYAPKPGQKGYRRLQGQNDCHLQTMPSGVYNVLDGDWLERVTIISDEEGQGREYWHVDGSREQANRAKLDREQAHRAILATYAQLEAAATKQRAR